MTYSKPMYARAYCLLLFILVHISIVSCTRNTKKEGFIQVDGGKVWYQIIGDGEGTPLLVLHGGPGSGSCAMIAGLSSLGEERPVVFYDQLGAGRSDRPADTSLWNREHFVNEIDLLRAKLGLKELHIMGHSWGGALLSEYMATQKPNGVKSLIFSSPLLSTSDWVRDANVLLSRLPESIQDTIYKYEKLKDFSAPAYLAATDSFYIRHLCRTLYPYDSVLCGNDYVFNESIYNFMWGPTEFAATGSLLDFDRTDELSGISQPILFVTGEYDEARPQTMYRYQKIAKNADVKVIRNAAHMTMIDAPHPLCSAINQFLHIADEAP